MSGQIDGDDRENRMSQGSLWLFALAQGLGVVVLNIVLRVLVS